MIYEETTLGKNWITLTEKKETTLEEFLTLVGAAAGVDQYKLLVGKRLENVNDQIEYAENVVKTIEQHLETDSQEAEKARKKLISASQGFFSCIKTRQIPNLEVTLNRCSHLEQSSIGIIRDKKRKLKGLYEKRADLESELESVTSKNIDSDLAEYIFSDAHDLEKFDELFDELYDLFKYSESVYNFLTVVEEINRTASDNTRTEQEKIDQTTERLNTCFDQQDRLAEIITELTKESPDTLKGNISITKLLSEKKLELEIRASEIKKLEKELAKYSNECADKNANIRTAKESLAIAEKSETYRRISALKKGQVKLLMDRIKKKTSQELSGVIDLYVVKSDYWKHMPSMVSNGYSVLAINVPMGVYINDRRCFSWTTPGYLEYPVYKKCNFLNLDEDCIKYRKYSGISLILCSDDDKALQKIKNLVEKSCALIEDSRKFLNQT